MKLLPSLFSRVCSRMKLFVFAMNGRRRYSTFVCFIYGLEEKNSKSEVVFAVCRLPLTACSRTFAPIATAHRYCARKFTRHVMHRARTIRNKTNSDREDGHCYNFAWVLRSWDIRWPLLFLSETQTDCIYNDQKWTKTERGKLKEFQDFCPRDIESCNLATARCVKLWSLNSNLFF